MAIIKVLTPAEQAAEEIIDHAAKFLEMHNFGREGHVRTISNIIARHLAEAHAQEENDAVRQYLDRRAGTLEIRPADLLGYVRHEIMKLENRIEKLNHINKPRT